ncbi:MAG TPA: hypothetical protein VK680_13615 [Solirubrobacteraceae bacterium]|jgi:hypothetical protein|nr:hypothetical protein [Solirubrobacteraceae bacterium]
MYRRLTRLEVEAVLRREVKHYMSLGLTKAEAIQQVATDQGLDPEWVAELVDGEPGGEA